MACENGNSKLLAGLFIGAIAGAAVALLTAPKSGSETRRKLRDEAQSLMDDLEFYSLDLSDKACKIKDDLQEKLDQVLKKLHISAKDVEQKISENKSNF